MKKVQTTHTADIIRIRMGLRFGLHWFIAAVTWCLKTISCGRQTSVHLGYPALCLWVISGSFCFGADSYRPVYTDPLLEPWRWQVFPDLTGLGAQCIAEGADGTIWFGASEGAWSFDGVEWTHYPPKDVGGSDIKSICQGSDGRIYAAANREISRFNGQHWESLLYESGLLPGGNVRKIAAGGDGILWVATSRGLLRYQQSEWTLYTGSKFAQRLRSRPNLPSGRIELLPEAVYDKMHAGFPINGRYDFSDVCVDAQDRVWLGTEEGEILCFDPASAQPTTSNTSSAAKRGKWSVYNETDGMVCGQFPSILAAQDGRIWVVYGANSGHANVFNGQTWSIIDLSEVGAPQNCGNLLQTRDGVIWVSGRYVVGALRDGQWHKYEKPEVPIPSTGNFLLQTADGVLWLGGPDTEIMRVDYQTPRWLTLKDLNFQWESPAGEQWFLHRDGRVVVHKADQWTSYSVEDGVPDAPVALIGTQSGTVWVAGSHKNVAATARFDGRQWTRTIHDDFSWGIDCRGVMESSDGSVWFSATVDSHGPLEHCRGILQYQNGKWIHHHQPGQTPQGGNDTDPMTLLPATQRPEPIGKFYSLGESGDGRIWAGRNILICRDEKNWHVVSPPTGLQFGTIETMFSSQAGELWIGTQQFGALRYLDGKWQAFQGKDSLVANTVHSIAKTTDGSIWMATDRGFSHYDDRTWTLAPLPEALNISHDSGSLRAAGSGALWINRHAREWIFRAWPRFHETVAQDCEFWTVRYQFRGTPPETVITTMIERVPPPGNLAVFWGGSTSWRQLKESQLAYSYRLDDQQWSPFLPETGHSFFALPIGRHRLEVRAQDRDFNIDPTPAMLEFVVLPPVWYQAWFIILILVFVGLALVLSLRVVLERSRLRKLTLELDQRVNQRTAQLVTANKELETFAYSVSHDLRAPLRGIDGFSQILLEEYQDKMDEQGKDYLQRVRTATQHMGQLIDDLLSLSRIARSDMAIQTVDMSKIAQEIAETLRQSQPNRQVEFIIQDGIQAKGDSRLLRIVLENLLQNAWKFSSKHSTTRIEFGTQQHDDTTVYFVRDDGAGFDMNYAQRLFGAFQRLHTTDEFPGTGIGLATIQRIIHRHRGKIWAEGHIEKGAVFYFTIS